MSVKIFSIRLNLDKEKHRQAWEILQQLSNNKSWSYPDSISEALIALMAKETEHEKTEEEIVRSYADRIASATEKIIALTIPSFFAGLTVRGGTAALASVPIPGNESEEQLKEAGTDTIPDDEIPWDYLGE